MIYLLLKEVYSDLGLSACSAEQHFTRNLALKRGQMLLCDSIDTRDEKKEVQRQVDALLAKGYVQPSCNQYGSPVIFAVEADGTPRMCIDFRGLNKGTIKKH